MDNQKNTHNSPSSAQSHQPQQSQEASTQTDYAKYPWIPPQWIHHLSQAEFHHTPHASSPPQTPLPHSQPPTSPSTPSPALPQHSPHLSTPTPGGPSALVPPTPSTTSATEYPLFPRRRIPRPVPQKPNWLEYVSSLPWLLNSEISKGDRICPFCWGEFGMALVYEEEAAMASSASEDEGEHEGEGEGEDDEADVSEFFELHLATNDESASEIPLEQGLYVTNPDPPSPVCASEAEDEMQDEQWTELMEKQKRMVRQLRGEVGEEEPVKVGKKHYAVKLPCGHLYGHMCLVKMLESGEMTCPKCREDIVEGRVGAP